MVRRLERRGTILATPGRRPACRRRTGSRRLGRRETRHPALWHPRPHGRTAQDGGRMTQDQNPGSQWREARGLTHRVYITEETKRRLRAIASRLDLSPTQTIELALTALEETCAAADAAQTMISRLEHLLEKGRNGK